MNNENSTSQNNKAANPTQPNDQKYLSSEDKFKRLFFQVLIACLIGAATIAVIAVLAGGFNDTLGRALGTIALVALHAFFSFSYITEVEKQDKKDGGRSIELFSNTVFALIVISFITSIFATWSIISGNLTLKLYMAYIVLLFATLHADILYRIRKFEAKIDTVITINYALMSVVVIMLLIAIFASDATALGDLYFRILAAAGIVDATMTLSAVIMHKLYIQKHPQTSYKASEGNTEKSKTFWKNPLVVLLLIFLAFQLIGGLVSLVMVSLSI